MSVSPLACLYWLVALLNKFVDGVFELKAISFVLNGEGAGLLAVHQHRTKVDVIHWIDVVSEREVIG